VFSCVCASLGSILRVAAKRGPDVLWCVPSRAKCILFISVMVCMGVTRAGGDSGLPASRSWFGCEALQSRLVWGSH
jgi:hypothetical protein